MSRVSTCLILSVALGLAGCGGAPETPPLTIANPSEVPDLVPGKSPVPKSTRRGALDDSVEQVQ